MTSASTTNALRRLQEWYTAQCNGDWEHSYGVSIGTIDNPGWSLEVDLAGTHLEGKAFAELKRDYEHERDWLTCSIRDGKFMGWCGPKKLENMIEVFLAWAEES